MASRVFVALPIPAEQRAAIGVLQERLRSRLQAKLRLVPSDNLHLTLRFIGDADAGQLERLREALAALPAQAPVQLTLGGLGQFPERGAPSVVWLGLREGRDAVCRLARKIDEVVHGLGWAQQTRSYLPHLTLARARGSGGASGGPLPMDAVGPFVAHEIVLFESQRRAERTRYIPLHRVALSGPSSRPLSQ